MLGYRHCGDGRGLRARFPLLHSSSVAGAYRRGCRARQMGVGRVPDAVVFGNDRGSEDVGNHGLCRRAATCRITV